MIFTEMFNLFYSKKSNKKKEEYNPFSELKNDPSIVGFHIFVNKPIYYNYSYQELGSPLSGMQYVGSTLDEKIVMECGKAYSTPSQYSSNFFVLKGQLLTLNARKEKYNETVEKERVVGYELENVK